LIGIIIGTSIGFIGTLAINNFLGTSTLPAIDFLLIIATLASGFLIGAVAGIVPAMSAARQRPVEVLRD